MKAILGWAYMITVEMINIFYAIFYLCKGDCFFVIPFASSIICALTMYIIRRQQNSLKYLYKKKGKLK